MSDTNGKESAIDAAGIRNTAEDTCDMTQRDAGIEWIRFDVKDDYLYRLNNFSTAKGALLLRSAASPLP